MRRSRAIVAVIGLVAAACTFQGDETGVTTLAPTLTTSTLESNPDRTPSDCPLVAPYLVGSLGVLPERGTTDEAEVRGILSDFYDVLLDSIPGAVEARAIERNGQVWSRSSDDSYSIEFVADYQIEVFLLPGTLEFTGALASQGCRGGSFS